MMTDDGRPRWLYVVAVVVVYAIAWLTMGAP